MSIEIARRHLESQGLGQRILEFQTSSATVELAAQALGVAPQRIAKTLAFKKDEGFILVVAAGDARIDNPKFKQQFGIKAKMLTPDEAVTLTGHAVGGVCPFGVPAGAQVYTDVSLRRFDTVYPAAGSSNSAVRLSCDELFSAAGSCGWVDVCKGWQEET